MNVTRDVITDLLPVYASGEASADTRKLVEEFFHADPEFAALAGDASPLTAPAPNPKKEDAMDTLLRTKQILRYRSMFLALGLFFTMLPFSVLSVKSGTYILFRELPNVALFAVVMAIAGWSGYAWTWRRVRTTGL
jgi:hypothetical protein